MKDYFEHLDELPQHIKAIIDNFSSGENDYETCQQLVDALEQYGWSCDYTLESEPFDLKPLSTEQEYENFYKKQYPNHVIWFNLLGVVMCYSECATKTIKVLNTILYESLDGSPYSGFNNSELIKNAKKMNDANYEVLIIERA
jgi:hypothetical protein